MQRSVAAKGRVAEKIYAVPVIAYILTVSISSSLAEGAPAALQGKTIAASMHPL